MITFQNKNEFVRKNINLEDTSVSTLLIPDYMYEQFRLKTKKYKGNTAVYLHSLLRRFRTITYSGMIPEPEKLKTTYQERNLDLRKVSFKPKNEDWVEAGLKKIVPMVNNLELGIFQELEMFSYTFARGYHIKV